MIYGNIAFCLSEEWKTRTGMPVRRARRCWCFMVSDVDGFSIVMYCWFVLAVKDAFLYVMF